jgi:hypothetical protein
LWDELLVMPTPNPKLVALTAAFLYGRAVALAAKEIAFSRVLPRMSMHWAISQGVAVRYSIAMD